MRFDNPACQGLSLWHVLGKIDRKNPFALFSNPKPCIFIFFPPLGFSFKLCAALFPGPAWFLWQYTGFLDQK
ncbi:MAG: hypothetical protein LBO65_08240 [Spirochaetaceae bacterium]|nr:hypothetical protein [Spirochaetaceae bacterium]